MCVRVDRVCARSSGFRNKANLHTLTVSENPATYNSRSRESNVPSAAPMLATHSRPLVRVALQLLVRRHAVLRTFYQMSQTRVQQIILPADGFVVPLDTCSEEDWHVQSAQTLSQPFALTKAPPVRALLMCSDGRQCTRLLVVLEHVATDYTAGWPEHLRAGSCLPEPEPTTSHSANLGTEPRALERGR